MKIEGNCQRQRAMQNFYNNDSPKYIHNNGKKKIDLELENANLRMMIHLLESKNRILEENCFLLKDKTLDYQKRLFVAESSKSVEKDESEDNPKTESSVEENDDSGTQNLLKVRDGLGGAVFGVFLPKVANFIGKIHKKQSVVKEFLQEVDGLECPVEKVKCKDHILNLLKKVNLKRVVTVVGTFLLISGAGYLVYKTWKNDFRIKYLTDDKKYVKKKPEDPQNENDQKSI